MTNYNDGKWHGWNGGECPVHPKTEVEIVTSTPGLNSGPAGSFTWNEADSLGRPIIAFRVTKEHKEPREFWVQQGYIYSNRPPAKFGEEIIHVREVLK